jgi:uncharacterized membrane protein HdeD (DUF308 family)
LLDVKIKIIEKGVGQWVIGLFIGIDLIIVSWSQIMTAIAAHSICTPEPQ